MRVIGSGAFFFFKQKTAYEMRISDWSSDVCSSDLSASSQSLCHEMFLTLPDFAGTVTRPRAPSVDVAAARSSSPLSGVGLSRCALGKRKARNHLWRGRRSEEHTTELQSLMRISYAVFCLKKKTKKQK